MATRAIHLKLNKSQIWLSTICFFGQFVSIARRARDVGYKQRRLIAKTYSLLGFLVQLLLYLLLILFLPAALQSLVGTS